MKTLCIRTDKPEAEVYLYEDDKHLAQEIWLAHRELSNTLLLKITQLLRQNDLKLAELGGIVVFRGPGSFTGLRIGITIANSLAYALKISVVGTLGKNWQKDGTKKLAAGKDEKIVLPHYGAEPNITKPRK